MAINSVLQTIRNAEIDARSLSEFVSRDAYFTVTRRLAPTIHTLDYYLLVLNRVKDKGDLADIAISDTLDKLEQLEPTVIQRVEEAINNTVISSGFVTVDSFELGATITQRNQALRHAADGRLYRWAGDLPKVVLANSTPVNSGGIGDNAWLEVSDVTLRQDVNQKLDVITSDFKKKALNLDDFKTASNSDADAMYDMFVYARANNIKNLSVTRDITLDRKITLSQDEAKTLNNISLDFNGNKVSWTGTGASSLTIGIFEVKGVLTATKTTVVGDHAEYTSDLTVANGALFNVGDYILIDSTSTDITQLYLNHIVRVLGVNGNVLKTDTVRRLAAMPSVAPVEVTKVNTVDGFEIKGNPLFTADNQTSRDNGIGAIQYTYCTNSKAIASSEKLWFKTFRAAFCSRIYADCKGRDPAATGGGEGYVIQFEYTNLSTGRGYGDSMRHTVDVTASWHNTFVDCMDFNSASSSYGAHRAYEYNNHFIRCKSFASRQSAFSFGQAMFGDHTDETYLTDCEAYDFATSGISFANKGKGLYINGGVYRGFGYALTTGQNDTFAYNARFESGVRVTKADYIVDTGVCELHNCNTLIAPNLRSLNIVEGQKISLVGGKVVGTMSLGVDSIVETNGTHIVCPYNTSLIGDVQASLIMDGGKFETPVSTTKTQANALKEITMNGVEIVQGNEIYPISFNATKNDIKNCKGAVRLVFANPDTSSIELNKNDFQNLSTFPIVILSNSVEVVRLNSNKLKVTGTANAVQFHSSIHVSSLQMLGNDVDGNISIPDSQVTNVLAKDNMIKGTATLPTNDDTTKIVKDNIVTA